MSDHITVPIDARKFPVHPEGQFVAVCQDAIDLGQRVGDWKGKQKLQPRVALVFWTDAVDPATDDHLPLNYEVTVSMAPRAGMRLFLESWRGKKYADDAPDVELHKLEGHPALVTVEHVTTAAGRLFGKINSIVPLPKGMAKPVLPDYTRAPHWATRKAEYAEAAAQFARGVHPAAGFGDIPGALQADDSDDLPF